MQAEPTPVRSARVGLRSQRQPPRGTRQRWHLVLGVVGAGLVAGGVVAATALTRGAPTTAGRLEASAATDDVQISLEANSDKVAAGDELDMVIRIHNGRPVAIDLAPWECGAAASVEALLHGSIAPGRELEDPIERELRAMAMAGVGDSSAGSVVITRPSACSGTGASASGEHLVLDPGQELAEHTAWRPALVDGVPAAPGDVVITARAAYRVGTDSRGTYLPLVVSATGHITDGLPTGISAEQALDALLGDAGFGTWLRSAPSTSWTTVNVFLQNLGPAPAGIVPGGPSWEVDVFREVDGRRQSAIAFVDPVTGELRAVRLCDAGCGSAPD